MNAAAKTGAIRFAFASATLAPESRPALDQLADALSRCPDVKIRVEGHTDGSGDPVNNQALSELRAASVLEHLTKAGVSAARVQSAGFGSTKPVAGNDTGENRAKNRRIEFAIVPN